MSNLSKIFVELEIDSEIKLTTPEIQAKIAKFCRTNPNLESFYFAFLDEKVYRRFHLNDKEIQCLEMTRNDEDGPGDDSEVDVEME
uniref:Uncharacterized protein n=1 Tax=Panagrolaimus sp. JU765 TaxID=591449 RepID=A0AC34QXS0_9BILA